MPGRSHDILLLLVLYLQHSCIIFENNQLVRAISVALSFLVSFFLSLTSSGPLRMYCEGGSETEASTKFGILSWCKGFFYFRNGTGSRYGDRRVHDIYVTKTHNCSDVNCFNKQ